MIKSLQEAFGFKVGQPVAMLVETSGGDGGENDETVHFPKGAIGIIDSIDDLGRKQGIAFTVSIEGTIVNVFDQGDGPIGDFLEKINLDEEQILNIETFVNAATQHAEDSDEPDHEVGDLQDMLRVAYGLLTKEQKYTFFNAEEVRNVLIGGNVLPD